MGRKLQIGLAWLGLWGSFSYLVLQAQVRAPAPTTSPTPPRLRILPTHPSWYQSSTMMFVAMNLRLSKDDSALLRALADAEHVSLHEAALRAIRRSAREVAHTGRVREATAEMLDRWGEVLDRLGQA